MPFPLLGKNCTVNEKESRVRTDVRDPNRLAQDLFRPLPRRYDVLEELLSFGQNGRWRREMLSHIDGSPRAILDVATGTAGVALALHERTEAHITGLDITEAMLRRGQQRVVAADAVNRVDLVVAQAEHLPFADASFDALTFTYLMRYVVDPEATMGELARVLRPGAPIASLEFSVPPRPFWRFWWTGYTRLALPVAGYVTGGRDWFRVGRFLGPSISAHDRAYGTEWMCRAWTRAGLDEVDARSMSLGGGLVMWGRKAR
jgi:demethylmenaquinone methyltransferase/2-methoxy-6-polyprenyl-1,4-benzoquinol methylase